MKHSSRPLSHALRAAAIAVLVTAAAPASWAQLAGVEREEVQGADITQNLGAEIPLGTEFQNDEGEFVTIGDAFGDVPVLLTLNYVDCPLLCSMQLETLTRALAEVELDLGVDYRVITVSIHPGDSVAQLRAQKERYVTEYRGLLQDAGRDVDAQVALDGWTYLRGTRASIDAVADAVGFGYKWLPDEGEKGEYAHAAPTIVCSSEGVVTQYQQGVNGQVSIAARNLRLFLVDASDGKIGSLLDELFLTCFKYDPSTGNYRLAFGMLRGAAALTVVAILAGLFFMRRSADGPDDSGPGARLDSSSDQDGPPPVRRAS